MNGGSPMKMLGKLLFLLAFLVISWQVTLAQSTGADVKTIEVAQVDNSAYPDVIVYVRVLDAEDKRVPNLTVDQFAIQEDGQPVEIIDFSAINEGAIQTLMLIDTSGSMRDSGKIEGAKEAALAFIDLMRPQDQVGLIVFNNRIYDQVDFTSEPDRLRRRIQDLYADGGTSWYDAVITASEQIANLSGRKSLLLLTDGLDEDSRNSFNKALNVAQSSEASVYTIGLGQSGEYDQERLGQIADATNGNFYHAPTATELEALYRSIAQTTQDEYVLTYRSPRPEYDGTRRNIQVTVGEAGGSGGYVETHLVTVRSDWLVGLACLVPLALLLSLPPLGRAVLRRRRQAQSLPQQIGQQWAPVPPPPPPAGSEGAGYPPAQSPAGPGSSWQPTAISSSGVGVTTTASACSHCGRPLKAGARFCSGCGHPVAAAIQTYQANQPPPVSPTPPQPASWVCSHCGKQLRAGARFCNACGKPV